ncbi:MAG: helix-hairpin-helix domain-containing protein [Bacteroidota bacterium]
MWKAFVQDYLSFTKKDRVGVMVLIALILVVVVLPYAWPPKKMQQPARQEIEQIRMQAAQLNQPTNTPEDETKQETALYTHPSKKQNAGEKSVLFNFDPNTLEAADWKRLGIREKTIVTIMNYRARGGQFRRPEDISKIYGLFKDDYERLLPYVQIAAVRGAEDKNKQEQREYKSAGKPVYVPPHPPAVTVIDINAADTTAFIALPGIGSKLALRIINFRNKLGGFYSVQQVAETYGLPDSTFQAIQGLLRCANPVIHQLDINTADANTLRQHPYIRWNLANAIVQYRAQHGNFVSVEDLRQLALVTPEILQKIKPYVTVQ